MKEQWRPIDAKYEASNFGRIRNGNRILKQRSHNGYRYVRMPTHSALVHRLVARAWLGLKQHDKRWVKHRRGRSCRVSNLYLCSVADSHKRRPAKGEQHCFAKLTNAKVLKILALRNIVPQLELAARYGVSRTAISDVWHGRTWCHVTRAATARQR